MILFAAVFILALSFILYKIFYDKQFPRFDKPEFTNELRFCDVTGYDRERSIPVIPAHGMEVPAEVSE